MNTLMIGKNSVKYYQRENSHLNMEDITDADKFETRLSL